MCHSLPVVCETMSALLAFLATATLSPIFDPKFAPVIISVANKYFQQPSRLIIEMSNDPYSVFASEAIKGHNASVVVQKLPLPSVEEMKKTMNGKCDILVFLGPKETNSYDEGGWRTLRWNPGGRVIIVTQGDAARALKIIRSIWTTTRTKSVLLAAINNKDIEFYQWSPYKIGECRNVLTVDLLDTWKNGKFTRNSSFYYMDTELSSLNGCDLLYTATEVFPYVLKNNTRGIEIKLLELLATSLNFSPRFVAIPASEHFFSGKILNGTKWAFSGPLKMLYEHQVDLAFSGMTAHIDRYEASTPVFPHMMENIVWTAPAPRVMSPIQNAFRALSPSTWFSIILSLLLGSFAVYVTHDPQCSTYRICFFYTLGVLLNGMPSFRTSNWYLRIITIGVIILAMHFFIAYQSTLILLLTTPMLEKPYNSLKDVMEANLTCYVYSAGSRLLELQQEENIPKYYTVVAGLLPDHFREIAYNRTSYLLMPEIPSNFLSWRKYLDENGRNLLTRLKAPFMFLPISFYMAPGHPLAPLMGEKILRMVECGIVDYWSGVTKKIKFTSGDHQRVRKLQPLSIYHLMGAFAVVLGALTASVVVFIIEVLIKKFCTKIEKNRKVRFSQK